MTPDELAMFIRKYIMLYMQAKIVTDETPKLTTVSPDSLAFHHCDNPFQDGAAPYVLFL